MLKFDKAGSFDPEATVDAVRTGGFVTYDLAVKLVAQTFSVGISRGWDASEGFDRTQNPDWLRTHDYTPHPKHPGFCRHCGYPEHERLRHAAPPTDTKGGE